MTLIKYERQIREYPVWALDTEDDGHGNFVCGAIATPFNTFVFKRDEKSELVKMLGQHVNAIMCGMNLAYDLNNLLPEFAVNRLEHGGRFITIKYADKKAHFRWLDIQNFILGKSLKQISDKMGIPYLDVHDYTDTRIYEACRSHAEAARQVMIMLQNQLVNLGGSLEYTSAKTALRLFQTRFLRRDHQFFDVNYFDQNWPKDKESISHQMQKMKEYTNNAYRGAETNIFRTGYFAKAICYDVKSMYPSVMLNAEIPDMNRFAYFGELDVDNFRKLLTKYEGCALVNVEVPNDYIPYFLPTTVSIKGVNRYIHQRGAWYGYLTFPELRYIDELGYRYEVLEGIKFGRLQKFFYDYVQTLYKLKEKSQYELAAKLLLNSLYGKFGQYNEPEGSYEIITSDTEIDIESDYEYNGLKYKYVKSNDNSYPGHSYPLIAAYITALARIKLHRAIVANAAKVLYCDTDSIIASDECNLDVGNQLGQWEKKWEGEWEGRGLKYYRYRVDKDWQYVIKGVPGCSLDPQKYKREFWSHERVTFYRPTKFRTAIRSGRRANDWVAITYVRRNVLTKRYFYDDGSSSLWSDKQVERLYEEEIAKKEEKFIKKYTKTKQGVKAYLRSRGVDVEAYYDTSLEPNLIPIWLRNKDKKKEIDFDEPTPNLPLSVSFPSIRSQPS